jgi:hypothetical protein
VVDCDAGPHAERRPLVQGHYAEDATRDDAESVPYGLRLYLENGAIGTWE